MCRWFAYISPEETCLLSDVLIDPANALSKQVSEHYLPTLLPHDSDRDLDDAPDKLVKMRNSLLNMDGLGVAWYTPSMANYYASVDGQRPAVYKSQQPPTNDFNFKNLCQNTESRCVLAHVRATSGSVVHQANCHPFVFGRHVFMHNGAVSDFTAIRRDMEDLMQYDAYANIFGTTDSEHCAALYMTHLTGGAGAGAWQQQYSISAMYEALVATVKAIMTLQQRRLGAKMAPNSLNFCATDGARLVAIRFRNHKTQQPPSLYWSEFAGRTLNSKYPGNWADPGGINHEQSKNIDEGGRHTIVASEPTTYDESEWHIIGKNCALTVDEFGVEKEVPIEYDPALNGVDPSNP